LIIIRNRRVGLAALALLLVGLGAAAARLDVPKLSGPIKGDEATYIAMAFSVAKDGDLKYKPEDYRRFVQLYGTGPNGIFLKESFDLDFNLRAGWPPVTVERTAVSTDAELDYGKAFAYAVAAAPFAGLFGLGGLLLFNVLLLLVCVWCAVLFCRAKAGPVAGTVMAVAFIAASVVPVYVVWQTSEIFNFSLVLFAYFLWLYKEVAPPSAPGWLRNPRVDWVAVVLLGIATFSKPNNAPLIAPLVLFAWFRHQWARGLILGVVFTAVTAGLFGVNALVSGDLHYQGGDNRATFHTRFPFDDTGRRFETGQIMTTNEANEEGELSPSFLIPTLRHNLVYFMVGRDAGFIPYFFPGALVVLLWLSRIRHARVWEWLTAGGCLLAVLGTLVFAPNSWNGGGGPIGNRYFLSIYATLLFLVPAATGVLAGVAAMAVGLVIVGTTLVHPFAIAQSPWLLPERWPLRLLPVEFTLINNIPIALTGPLRAHIEVSKDPEVFLYYMDSNTYGREVSGDFVGNWIRGDATADIVVRTGEPLTNLQFLVSSRVANDVEITLGGRSAPTIHLTPGEEELVQLRPGKTVKTLGYQVLLRIKNSAGFYPRQFEPGSTDTRFLGVFVKMKYEAGNR
jgi:hypothetical protein